MQPKETSIFPVFTEDTLALEFADRHEQSLRYVAALGRWLVWTDTHWQFDDTLAARDKARQICREFAGRCNDQKLSKAIASAKTVSAVERLAQADRRIAATIDQFDVDPWLLNTPGGTVDLRNAEVRPHNPSDYITKLAGTAPDYQMKTPVWDGFLSRVTSGNADLIAFLQRMAGYALTGSTQEHALFFLHGLGANGKTTFVNAIKDAAGDYHRTTPIETFTASNHDRHPTELAGLRGARIVSANETEEGRRWAESRIKTLTGGDRIAARFMRQDFFEYTPQFKLLIAGNHKPGLRSVDEAIRRRFNLIPFTASIPPEERDEELPEKLKAELPGILAWMIIGCVEWLERGGLAPPQIVTDATTEYLEDEDAIAAWIEECCVRDAAAKASIAELFESWAKWATKAGEPITSQRKLGEKLHNRNFVRERGTGGVRSHRGLKLKPSFYSYEEAA